ncbi:MAG TPA: hypothetical protein VMH77_04575 [Steroidobacteraceae bacterium]|nr:hypothetical protein [Steroidobacteraceae bacterium]
MKRVSLAVCLLAAASARTFAAEDSGAPATGANANAFNPAMSVILNGFYTHHSLSPSDYSRDGFPLGGEAGPLPQGLSIGESELALAANVDEKFFAQLTMTVENEDGHDNFGIEEAFVDTTALPDGLTLRAGRFYSNIGYLNSHHPHTDKFSDRPLPYQAFLGNQYGDDGVQLRWVPPTDLFIELGGEAFRGVSFPSAGAQHSGVGVDTLFAHVGGDLGVENSWLAGVSMLHSKTAGADDGFSGINKLYIADLTWKWAPGGNTKDGGFLVRSEYFIDDRNGTFADPDEVLPEEAWSGKRRGWYAETVYRINRQWETGYRYDQIWAPQGAPFASGFDPYRHSLVLTWLNSEFSLVRLQLSRDHPSATATDNAVSLQIQTTIGAHGAHKF